MKASICTKYGGPEVYKILDVDRPIIKDTEVLVEVESALVTPTDSNFRSGKPYIARLFSGLLKPRVKIHGEMFIGRVVEVGNSIEEFEVNDIVYGSNGMKLGSYAEYVNVDVKSTIKKVPDDFDLNNVLTLLDGGITALPFLRELGNIKPNQKVLINGASGSVGSMALMLSKHFKAHVTATTSIKNIETVKSLGADEVIDYKSQDFTKNLNQYDIIFDAVGKRSFKECRNALTETGIYMTTVPTPGLMLKSLFKKEDTTKKRAGFMATGLRKKSQKIDDLEYLEELLKNQEIKPLIGKSFNLEELSKAQEYVETGHKLGNVILKVKS